MTFSAPRYGPLISRAAHQEAEKLNGLVRGDHLLRKRISRYFSDINFPIPVDVDHYHYSAVFISWCVATAGVGRDVFAPVQAHSEYVQRAFRTKVDQPFRAHAVNSFAPRSGDIVNFNRSGGSIDFARAPLGHYPSESGIVIGHADSPRRLAVVIGNDKDGSVAPDEWPIDHEGRLVQRALDSFICIVAVDP